jgi:hypothetical protein
MKRQNVTAYRLALALLWDVPGWILDSENLITEKTNRVKVFWLLYIGDEDKNASPWCEKFLKDGHLEDRETNGGKY